MSLSNADLAFYGQFHRCQRKTTRVFILGNNAFCELETLKGDIESVVRVPYDAEKDSDVLFYFLFARNGVKIVPIGGATVENIKVAGGYERLKGERINNFGKPLKQSFRVIPRSVLHVDAPEPEHRTLINDVNSFDLSFTLPSLTNSVSDITDAPNVLTSARISDLCWWTSYKFDRIVETLCNAIRSDSEWFVAWTWAANAVERRSYNFGKQKPGAVFTDAMATSSDALTDDSPQFISSVAVVGMALCVMLFVTDQETIDNWLNFEVDVFKQIIMSPRILVDVFVKYVNFLGLTTISYCNNAYDVEGDPALLWTWLAHAGGPPHVCPRGRGRFRLRSDVLCTYVLPQIYRALLIDLIDVRHLATSCQPQFAAARRMVYRKYVANPQWFVHLRFLSGCHVPDNEILLANHEIVRKQSRFIRAKKPVTMLERSHMRIRPDAMSGDIEDLHKSGRVAPCLRLMYERVCAGKGHFRFEERNAWVPVMLQLGLSTDVVIDAMHSLFVDKGGMDAHVWKNNQYDYIVRNLAENNIHPPNCSTMLRKNLCPFGTARPDMLLDALAAIKPDARGDLESICAQVSLDMESADVRVVCARACRAISSDTVAEQIPRVHYSPLGLTRCLSKPALSVLPSAL